MTLPPRDPDTETDPLVCHCMKVRKSRLCAAIRAGHRTLAALGDATRAGLGCGTCRTDLLGLIAAVLGEQNAESANAPSCHARPPSS